MSPSSLLVPGLRRRQRVVSGHSPAFGWYRSSPRAGGRRLFAAALMALVPGLLLE